MIGFMYEGYFYCANVHKLPAMLEYHVAILATKLPAGMPAKLTLRDEESGLKHISAEPVSPAVLDIVTQEIEKHEHISFH